jgi:hypothetical protein
VGIFLELITPGFNRTLFFSDSLGAEALPDWVTKSSQTTDGHLSALAASQSARLATFDSGIPDAEIIG